MAKEKITYSCTECGATNPKWQGQCPGCGEWNTLGSLQKTEKIVR